MKIDKLTAEQEQQVPVYRDMGLAIGLATGPCDRPRAVKAMQRLYKHLDQKSVPEAIIFVRSPYEAQLVGNELRHNDKGEKKLKSWTAEGNDAWVAGIVAEAIASGKKNHSFIDTHTYGYGSNESYWVLHYRFFSEQCGIKFDDKAAEGLDIFNELALSSGWHYLFDKAAIICDRPVFIAMENAVISNDEGPCVEFSDGNKIFALGGHEVTEQIVMRPDTITLEQIDKEPNAETKRIMIERFGASKYMFETDAKIIDSDSLNLEGSSLRSLMEDKHGHKWLIGTDGSTGRVYHMSVPAEAKTCSEAHSLIAGIPDIDDALIGEC